MIHDLTLSLLPGIGTIRAKALVDFYETSEQVLSLTEIELKNNSALSPSIVNALSNKTTKVNSLIKAQKELEFAQKKGIEIISYKSEDYPKHLKECNDAPFLLFKKGKSNLVHQKNIAIVGARRATNYGKDFTEAIVRNLSNYNCCIVSGLANGIDASAHKSALKFNTPTIGVLGHGLDTIYPSDHRALAIEVINNGALITEYFSGVPSLPANFPKRNRIVAGMVDAVIIVEAAIKGGALVTAKIAETYQKDIYAVPGRVNDQYSKGCNHLIKTQKAILLDQPEELAMELGWEQYDLIKKFDENKLLEGLNPEECTIVKLLKTENLNHDELIKASKMNSSELSNTLLMLEMKDKIKPLPGNTIQLNR